MPLLFCDLQYPEAHLHDFDEGDCGGLIVRSGHPKQRLMARCAYRPAWHCVQFASPDPSAANPAGQSLHVVDSLAFVYRPGSHWMHCVDPLMFPNQPAGHDEQLEPPVPK